jgi:hypothetical protein
VQAAERASGVDLEALESAIRTAVHAAGAQVLEYLLTDVGVGRRNAVVRCRCGAVMDSRGVKGKSVQTLLGWVRFSRSAYQCPACGRTRYPGDEELDVVKTRYSPGIRRLVSDVACDVPFKRVSRHVRSGAGLSISRKDCERIAEGVGEDMARWVAHERDRLRSAEPPPPGTPKTIETLYIEFDGTGVPMVPHEVAGRKGKQEDGSAKTREAKLGCVFTQTLFDEDNRPIRDPASTSFMGAIEPAAQFGWRIYAEAVRRGLFEAKHVVVLGDGAEWVKNIAGLHFGQAQFVIDFYHAKEHVMDLCHALFDRDLRRLNHYKDRWWDLLADGALEQLIEEAQGHLPKDPRAGKQARTQIGYFEKNKKHMRYADYRAHGLFIGSGVIEAGCKSIIGHRLKQSGMEWTVRGANAITALRCVIQSNRFEDYWETRTA